ncbi:CTP synthase C-terminal region-related (seleno)protein [Leptolyngbya sp. NIES-2104]|uniref:CTP synthase C-terminal region-related (seleno)protein n=1 Tax=Leptolyngbya sp. NIES-2104 TaxID=1552121 RepID=UPI0006EC4610|nr:CTP synthase [Leptolyngbya sp. NIES-2104]GAP96644.1 CTP synthase [Leptolyngbya sp. NIES-2104]
MEDVLIALVGDLNPSVTAHQAIPKALERAATCVTPSVNWCWVATETISSSADLEPFDAFWCVPASPYKNMDGALTAIRYARENQRPFLGTCGGFQHAVVEYARNVMGLSEADHAESNPNASLLVVTPLTCSLKGKSGSVHFADHSRLARIYGTPAAVEAYHCSYGMNPNFEKMLLDSDMRVSARDEDGEARAIELSSHPFFVATLFQPERAALSDLNSPLVVAFVASVRQQE